MSRLVLCLGALISVVSATAAQPLQKLDLNGVWDADDASVLIRQRDPTTIDSVFCLGGTTASGQRLPFFIQGTLTGSSLKGDMMRAASDPMVARGASQSFKTSFTASGVTSDRISGTFKLRSYTVQRKGSGSVLVEQPSTQDEPFSLTRRPCEEDLKQQIREAKAQLEVKRAVRDTLDPAVAKPTGSWNEFYRAVRDQVSAGRGGGAEFGGGVDVEYSPNDVPLRQANLKLSFKCPGSGVTLEMCEKHERAHFADIERAWNDFKNKTWTPQRYTDYVNGTTRNPSDVARRLKDEFDRHASDVTFLEGWLRQANEKYLTTCLECS